MPYSSGPPTVSGYTGSGSGPIVVLPSGEHVPTASMLSALVGLFLVGAQDASNVHRPQPIGAWRPDWCFKRKGAPWLVTVVDDLREWRGQPKNDAMRDTSEYGVPDPFLVVDGKGRTFPWGSTGVKDACGPRFPLKQVATESRYLADGSTAPGKMLFLPRDADTSEWLAMVPDFPAWGSPPGLHRLKPHQRANAERRGGQVLDPWNRPTFHYRRRNPKKLG